MRPVEPTMPTTDQLVRCNACGRTEACTPEDLLAFMSGRWPTCCAAVMTYYKSAIFTGSDNLAETKQEVAILTSDTALATPPLTADAEQPAE